MARRYWNGRISNRKIEIELPVLCDGETLFGFTVKQCTKTATIHVRNGTHEHYWFCPEHYQHYLHGSQGPETKPDESDKE